MVTRPSNPDQAAAESPRLLERIARIWRSACTIYQVLLLVRFSLLLGVIGGLVLVLNDQAQDVVRALSEEPERVGWLVAATIVGAAVAWWSARVMLYFRFHNPASAPTVLPGLKEHLPRAIGALALVLVAIALIRAAFSYQGLVTGPAGHLLALALLFLALAAGFIYVTARRRDWLGLQGPRPGGLRSLAELHWQAWLPLVLAGAAGFGLMVVFAYHSVALAPKLGTAAIGLLAVLGLIPFGTLLVYWGNRARLPVVTLALIWAAFSSWAVDNHYVRLNAQMDSYAPPAPPAAKPTPGRDPAQYLEAWLGGRKPAADGRIPVFIVATEGGGIRAAYWTALVLGELQDRAAAAGLDFAGHVLAISGVSGGSLGAATFDALLANRSLTPKTSEDCPVDQGVDPKSLRGRAERVLSHDFLSPTVAVMLFPDMFQQFVPYPFLNDRAVAIEQAFEAAWRDCEEGDLLAQPFDALWPASGASGVPLLFLNSTVVETGERLIAAPVRIEHPAFNEALDSRAVVGPDILLSTAVHDSARFTYVSPAGTVRRQDSKTPQWLRLVDGGYFENSGAVTAAEILRLLRTRPADGRDVHPVVIHISNDPEVTDTSDLAERSKWLNQVVAPIKALLHVRSARGFQAREDLAVSVGPKSHLHFRLCRKPEQEAHTTGKKAPLPLGWALSELARDEMRSQLGVADDGVKDAIQARNQANLGAVLALLEGEPVAGEPEDPWGCPDTAPPAAAS